MPDACCPIGPRVPRHHLLHRRARPPQGIWRGSPSRSAPISRSPPSSTACRSRRSGARAPVRTARPATSCRSRRISSAPSRASAWRSASTRSMTWPREIDELTTPPMPKGFMDALKMLPLANRLTDLMPKTVKDAPVPGNRSRRDGGLDELPILKTLAGRRRAVHHAAARVHARSRNRHAQHRHLPHAGVRSPHDRHALAAPQRRRAAPSRRGTAGQAARSRRRARRRSRPAPTAPPRRCPKDSTS